MPIWKSINFSIYISLIVKKSAEQFPKVAVDSVAQATDHKMSVCVAFLDLRKAFDSLNHHILLKRLNLLEVCKSELLWFASYQHF